MTESEKAAKRARQYERYHSDPEYRARDIERGKVYWRRRRDGTHIFPERRVDCATCGVVLVGNERLYCSARCRKTGWRRAHGMKPAPRREPPLLVGPRGRPRRWRPDTIIAAMQAWAAQFGEPPSSQEWAGPTTAPVTTRWRREAFAGAFPSRKAVRLAFGNWNTAMRAAGFEPRDPAEAGRLYGRLASEGHRKGS